MATPLFEPSISVVIRAYNEAEKLEELLQSIKNQDYPKDKVQIIVVDNGSTDVTETVIKKYGADSVFLAQSEFTYPKSLNLGCAQAKHEFIVSLSGHCLLRGTAFFRQAVRHFVDPKVAGAAGTTLPRKPATFSEYLIMYPLFLKDCVVGEYAIQHTKSGALQNVNSIFRRELWEQHHFNEKWEAGGEDYEWAGWALKNDYRIIHDPKMTVYHSHHLNLIKMMQQKRLWKTLLEPRPFRSEDLEFRKDINR